MVPLDQDDLGSIVQIVEDLSHVLHLLTEVPAELMLYVPGHHQSVRRVQVDYLGQRFLHRGGLYAGDVDPIVLQGALVADVKVGHHRGGLLWHPQASMRCDPDPGHYLYLFHENRSGR